MKSSQSFLHIINHFHMFKKINLRLFIINNFLYFFVPYYKKLYLIRLLNMTDIYLINFIKLKKKGFTLIII